MSEPVTRADLTGEVSALGCPVVVMIGLLVAALAHVAGSVIVTREHTRHCFEAMWRGEPHPQLDSACVALRP